MSNLDVGPSGEELRKLALKSVNTEEEAERVIRGELVDAWLLKILLDVENKSGAIFVLASEVNMKILQIFSMMGTSKMIRKIRTFEKFQQFADDMLAAYREGGIESNFSERIGRTLYRLLSPDIIAAQLPNFHYNRTSEITDIIIKGVAAETKVGNIQVQIELERVNSIFFRLNNPLSGVYNEVQSPFIEMASSKISAIGNTSKFSAIPKTKIDLAIEDLISQYKEVVKCTTVVSPVSGVNFDDLKEGQRLLFKLPFKAPEEKIKARRLGAVNPMGQLLPVVGTFLRLIVGPKDEYHIFAKGPKGVLLRAFEERPVRLAIPRDSKGEEAEIDGNTKALWAVIIGFVVFVLVLTGISFL
jgi:hypothetical protein